MIEVLNVEEGEGGKEGAGSTVQQEGPMEEEVGNSLCKHSTHSKFTHITSGNSKLAGNTNFLSKPNLFLSKTKNIFFSGQIYPCSTPSLQNTSFGRCPSTKC